MRDDIDDWDLEAPEDDGSRPLLTGDAALDSILEMLVTPAGYARP